MQRATVAPSDRPVARLFDGPIDVIGDVHGEIGALGVPIENAVNGITSLKTLRSKSVLGLSSVVLIFNAKNSARSARYFF